MCLAGSQDALDVLDLLALGHTEKRDVSITPTQSPSSSPTEFQLKA